jgi:D-ribulokinase
VEVVCGLDVGTSGARAFAVDETGNVIARANCRFDNPPYQPEPGYAEQDALEWWHASRQCLVELSQQLGQTKIIAIAIDSTSGTVVPVDKSGKPLMPALMYNDGRAKGLENAVNEAAGDFIERSGYAFPPAFALVKLLWLKQNRPKIVEATHKFLLAADFLVGKLTDSYETTDTSNALKSGVDLLTGEWPDFIEKQLGIPLEKFPRVFKPGEKVGEVSTEAAAETGLPVGTPIVAGATDGTASFLATGAKSVGDWNITIGTTIAIRGVSDQLVRDPLGRIYCHRHPEGFWLPGGASNVGGEALIQTFGSPKIAELDQTTRNYLPTSLLVYPLARQGERMPFVSAEAQGFTIGDATDEAALFAAYLEGIAMVATWSIEEANALGAPINGEFFLSGGGAHGKNLGRVIASILEKPLIVAREPDAAMGSALLAAGWAWHDGSVSAAQAVMVERVETLAPIPQLTDPLKNKLQELKIQCQQRGYR